VGGFKPGFDLSLISPVGQDFFETDHNFSNRFENGADRFYIG
jgi:hypothetical protein